MLSMRSLHYVLAVLLLMVACSKKEDPEVVADSINFLQPSPTNTIMLSPGQTINFEVKVTAQNMVKKLEGYSLIDKQAATLFLEKEFATNSHTEIYSGSYTVPANTPNFTDGELEFRLYDKSNSGTPVKVSKLSFMIH